MKALIENKCLLTYPWRIQQQNHDENQEEVAYVCK